MPWNDRPPRCAGQHRLNYDDGDVELLDLAAEKVDWRPAPPRSTPQPPADGLSSSAAEGGTPNADDKDVPATVGVVCNDKVGSFDVKGMCIVMAGGRTVSATEFERLAGKAASKKWKSSIRVDKVGCDSWAGHSQGPKLPSCPCPSANSMHFDLPGCMFMLRLGTQPSRHRNACSIAA